MKIAFINELFLPFAPGGGEWSTYYLAKSLAKKGNRVIVITPNYGAPRHEIMEGVTVKRFPFYAKLQKNNIFLGNFFYTNPVWYFWSILMYFWYLRRENPDVVHIHGKYSIPPIFIADIFLRKPLLATIRDYQVICNYGMCLTYSDKACSLKGYFLKDFPQYYQDYVKNKSSITLASNLAFAIWGRISSNFLLFFARKLTVVTLSGKQKEIFLANGFRKVLVIGNSTDFPNQKSNIKKENIVIFAGRLSKGKGVEIIIDSLSEFFTRFPQFKFVFAGEGFLKEKLLSMSQTEKRMEVLGQMEHDKLLALYRKAKLVIVPSLWPEPFGRIALEALSQGTPAVVTDKGGLPEIIKNGRWGVVVQATPCELLSGIKKALKNNIKLQKNIEKDMDKIKDKFGRAICEKYLNLYRELLK